MEGYLTLKQALDTLFETMDLNSYTLHEGKTGAVFTLRFRIIDGVNTQTNAHTQTNTHTQKKEQQQINCVLKFYYYSKLNGCNTMYPTTVPALSLILVAE